MCSEYALSGAIVWFAGLEVNGLGISGTRVRFDGRVIGGLMLASVQQEGSNRSRPMISLVASPSVSVVRHRRGVMTVGPKNDPIDESDTLQQLRMGISIMMAAQGAVSKLRPSQIMVTSENVDSFMGWLKRLQVGYQRELNRPSQTELQTNQSIQASVSTNSLGAINNAGELIGQRVNDQGQFFIGTALLTKGKIRHESDAIQVQAIGELLRIF